MRDIRQTKEYSLFLQKTGWQIIKKKSIYYFKKEIFPFFTVIKLQRPEKIDTIFLKKTLKTKGIINMVVEPKHQSQAKKVKDIGFRNIHPYLPSKTLVLNLRNKNIFATFKRDCKQAIKKTNGLKIEETKNVKLFQALWKSSVNYKRYVPPAKNLRALQKSFGDKSLFLTHRENGAISGAIFLRTKKVAHYWQAFTNTKARKRLVQYQIVWRGIKWAIKHNCSYFDFEGIYDNRFPNKAWLGFSHFKKSFGGVEISFPGTLSIWKVNIF